MMKTLLTMFLTVGICAAQAPDTHSGDENVGFLHISFVVKELDEGKATNARNYSTIITTGKNPRKATLRTGSKVPIPNGPGQITYIDLGANFDCLFLQRVGNSVMLFISADISSVAATTAEALSGSSGPVIRQNKWESNVIVPLGKPTTIYSSDDLSSKRKMQIEVTATPITP